MPVTGHKDAAIGQGSRGEQTSFAAHNADGGKTVRLRIVYFGAPTLADAEGFRVAAGQEHLSVLHPRYRAAVVRIHHRDAVPCTVAVVFRRFLRLVSGCVAAEDGDLIAQKHRLAHAAGRVERRQLLEGHLVEVLSITGHAYEGGEEKYEWRLLHYLSVTRRTERP